MGMKRSVHRTQWAAQFAVASELCKRGYQVALTMGNHPEVDLMVISTNRFQFIVDVKGQYKKNWWLISPKPPRENLFYVLAFVPDDEPNQYFVLGQGEMNVEIERVITAAKVKRSKKGLSVDKVGLMPGLSWNDALKFQNRWEQLPS